MNNTTQRLLLFAVAIPLILAAIFFLPYFHYAALVALVTVFSAGAARELAGIFIRRGTPVNALLFTVVGAVIPLAFYVSTFLDPLAGRIAISLVIVALLALFGRFAFASAEVLKDALPRAAAYALVFLYPGILAGFVVLIMADLAQPLVAILTYAAMVMGNDSLAWLFGVTLGRRRNLVAASPNKSLAGFAGGAIGSTVVAVIMKSAFPAALPLSWPVLVVFALAMAATVIVGDLFESALKRSAGAKDSGSLIPGRGGFLDSFDTVLYAAPLFYAASLAFGLFS